jgi:hypothetical protein
MTPEDSLLSSQWPATGLYPEPDESSPHPDILLTKIHFSIILPTASTYLKWVLMKNVC